MAVANRTACSCERYRCAGTRFYRDDIRCLFRGTSDSTVLDPQLFIDRADARNVLDDAALDGRAPTMAVLGVPRGFPLARGADSRGMVRDDGVASTGHAGGDSKTV